MSPLAIFANVINLDLVLLTEINQTRMNIPDVPQLNLDTVRIPSATMNSVSLGNPNEVSIRLTAQPGIQLKTTYAVSFQLAWTFVGNDGNSAIESFTGGSVQLRDNERGQEIEFDLTINTAINALGKQLLVLSASGPIDSGSHFDEILLSGSFGPVTDGEMHDLFSSEGNLRFYPDVVPTAHVVEWVPIPEPSLFAFVFGSVITVLVIFRRRAQD